MFRQKPVFKAIQLGVEEADELPSDLDDLEFYPNQEYTQIEQQQQQVLNQNAPIAYEEMTFGQQNDIYDLSNGNAYEGQRNYDNDGGLFNLPPIKVLNDHKEYYNRTSFMKGNSQDTCCICINEFQDGERIAKLNCEHTYHKKCIDKWIKRQKQCPLCKARIQKLEKFVIFDKKLELLWEQIIANHQIN